MEKLEGEENVLCRVYSSCISAHAFDSVQCDCREQMALAQQLIQKEGKGIIIWLEQEGKGNGHLALIQSIPFKEAGMSQGEAYEAAGFSFDARDFRPAANVLKHLGIKSIRMITNNPRKIESLTRHGIKVNGTIPTQ